MSLDNMNEIFEAIATVRINFKQLRKLKKQFPLAKSKLEKQFPLAKATI